MRKLFDETELTPADIGTVELNEAFAPRAVAVIRDAQLDPEKTVIICIGGGQALAALIRRYDA